MFDDAVIKNVQQYRDSKGLDTTDTTDTSDNSLALLRPTEETTRHQLGAHRYCRAYFFSFFFTAINVAFEANDITKFKFCSNTTGTEAGFCSSVYKFWSQRLLKKMACLRNADYFQTQLQ